MAWGNVQRKMVNAAQAVTTIVDVLSFAVPGADVKDIAVLAWLKLETIVGIPKPAPPSECVEISTGNAKSRSNVGQNIYLLVESLLKVVTRVRFRTSTMLHTDDFGGI